MTRSTVSFDTMRDDIRQKFGRTITKDEFGSLAKEFGIATSDVSDIYKAVDKEEGGGTFGWFNDPNKIQTSKFLDLLEDRIDEQDLDIDNLSRYDLKDVMVSFADGHDDESRYAYQDDEDNDEVPRSSRRNGDWPSRLISWADENLTKRQASNLFARIFS
jgi:hypothetical protein